MNKFDNENFSSDETSGVPQNKLHSQLRHHLEALTVSYRRLWQDRWNTMVILLVIGIAFALPASLFVLLQNVKAVSQNWQQTSQISLYLHTDISPEQTVSLLNRLKKQAGIANVNYISPAEGLAELQQQPDLKNALASLNTNPLPGVILVEPTTTFQSLDGVNQLLRQLQQLPQVDTAQLDMEWVKRLYGIIALGKRLVYALAFLLSLGVLFIIGNTIHLALQKYHHEIEVFKLVGATNSFIRRPFLYLGICYGLFGSIIAWFLVLCLLGWLTEPVQQLANLYHSDFHLLGISIIVGFYLMALGILLGALGAWFAINKYLDAGLTRFLAWSD